MRDQIRACTRGTLFGLALALALLSIQVAAATLSAGDLLMVDGHTSVLRIDPESGTVDVITRGGRFQGGRGLALEASGHILVSAFFVALPGGGTAAGVVRVDPATGGYFSAPVGIAVAEDGVIYVADSNAQAIVAIDPVTGAQTLLASGAELGSPSGLVVVPTSGKKKSKP